MNNRKSSTSSRQINCPTCQKTVTWSEDFPFRPFCSRQCQLIDFGDWASERNTIPAEDGPEDFRLDDLDARDNDSKGEDSEDF